MMNNLPLVILLLLVLFFWGATFRFLAIAQVCEDKMMGNLPRESSVDVVALQKTRAERSAGWCFALGFLMAALVVGTLDMPIQ